MMQHGQCITVLPQPVQDNRNEAFSRTFDSQQSNIRQSNIRQSASLPPHCSYSRNINCHPVAMIIGTVTAASFLHHTCTCVSPSCASVDSLPQIKTLRELLEVIVIVNAVL